MVNNQFGMKLENLISILKLNLLNNYTENQIHNYINQLIKVGFLNLNLNFTIKDPNWDRKLFKYISKDIRIKNDLTEEMFFPL
jgi:hypothetical protein